jgi:hypothetical protein
MNYVKLSASFTGKIFGENGGAVSDLLCLAFLAEGF